MKLDSEEQRALLLELIDNATFTGRVRRKVIELSDALENAKLEKSEQVEIESK